ncbi:hypothetical protein KDD17_17545 [Sulfitobacter albidus]|uniref:Uncharacterized protein n=1 Tax=Sulfitobacter albidus TaxID=2829501 RepID=A0A975JH77_9RHOB|nr:hypothetical protein [Sulfitobacter albidus]QUJ78146.1 hypothetical protein KDD17_17545 [Sulfitobacter albidus]
MARLELNPEFKLKDLGKEVLNAGRAAAAGDISIAEEAEERITGMFPEEKRRPTIKFVRDTKDLIHIVIPYLPDGGGAGSYADELAGEAMGQIVVYGCGR